MINFFLFGYVFSYDGVKFDGSITELVELYNKFLDKGRDYFPIGHNLFLILSSIYPDDKFDFENQNRDEFFYIISMPDTNPIPESIIL